MMSNMAPSRYHDDVLWLAHHMTPGGLVPGLGRLAEASRPLHIGHRALGTLEQKLFDLSFTPVGGAKTYGR